jgi:hypothetical protein
MFFFFVFCIFNFPVLGCLLVVLYHWRRKTIDARQRRSVLGSGHRDGSIFPSCALAFDSLTLRRAHFFCSSVHSLRRPITSIRAKLFSERTVGCVYGLLSEVYDNEHLLRPKIDIVKAASF